MKRNSIFSKIFGGLLLAAVLSLSACNRGYGCPYDFSISADNAVEAIAVLLPVMF